MMPINRKKIHTSTLLHAGWCILLFPLQAWSAGIKQQVAAGGVPEPIATGNLLQVTLALLAVLAAIAATAWALRRFSQLQSGANSILRVVAGVSIGPRERIVLIQVGEQQLLVGVAQGHVQTLHTLTHPVTPPQMGKAMTTGFAQRLAQAFAQSRARQSSSDRGPKP